MRVNSIDLMLFDLVTKKWKVLARSPQIGWQQWSRDSRYVYAGTKDAIVQIETRTGDMKQVLQLNGVRWAANFGGNMGGWFGLTPDDQILLLRDIGSEDIYAVDLEY